MMQELSCGIGILQYFDRKYIKKDKKKYTYV